MPKVVEHLQTNQNIYVALIANKIDKLFIMLYEDLNFLIEWEVEEKKKLDEQQPNAYSY